MQLIAYVPLSAMQCGKQARQALQKRRAVANIYLEQLLRLKQGREQHPRSTWQPLYGYSHMEALQADYCI